MQAIREIINVKGNSIVYKLPLGFNSKKVELIILPAEDEVTDKTTFSSLKKRWKKFEDSLPKEEPDLTEEEIISIVKEARAERYGKRKK